ncbi:hypothetical protein [Streptomyces sp. NPDC020298]|uniref:hypothetical protein n=1 Tax=unclassified Streptomyces TaxID=2593676 RepID=UPI00340F220D
MNVRRALTAFAIPVLGGGLGTLAGVLVRGITNTAVGAVVAVAVAVGVCHLADRKGWL